MDNGYIGDPDVILLADRFGHNNPFLEELVAAVQEDDSDSTVSSYISRSSLSGRQDLGKRDEGEKHKNIKLPEFWAHAPELWFCRAEFRFEVAGVYGEREMFAHVVEALTYDALKLVKDLMLSPPHYQPYQALKARLLLATQLTPIQMAERMMKEADLGDRRPSQLLASLLEFCPRGEENSSLFRAAFLMRLPAAIRGHLDGLEKRDLKDLAAAADRHWNNQMTSQREGVFATVEEESEEVVAAVGGQKKIFRQGKEKPADKWAALSTFTFCERHKRFGKECRKCGDPAHCQFEKMQAGN